ncbi:hypothetical protein EYF80_041361 [Liparis tanakae]|uniref:Uncharacterized protein n=1 Tax=Liparis tanakae TaxID=230148 RepID=A0A4Z2G5S6_9TELE|nr:hypothetical protein EYF80_041361 [Liparis tanakae]
MAPPWEHDLTCEQQANVGQVSRFVARAGRREPSVLLGAPGSGTPSIGFRTRTLGPGSWEGAEGSLSNENTEQAERGGADWAQCSDDP